MKNSIFYYLVLSLIVISCKQESDNKTKVSTETVTIEAEGSEGDTSGFDGTNCFSSNRIYGETAYMWQAGWVSYYNEYFPESEPRPNSPEIKFGSKKMQNLYDEAKQYGVPANEMGVIITYIMEDDQPDSFPYLAIQSIVNCTVVEGGLIYYKSPTELLDYGPADLNGLKQNWLNFLDPNYVFSVAEAYMYSWEALVTDGDARESGIAVNYGLRTLGLGEEEDFPSYDAAMENTEGTTEENVDGIVGSVVYCNVLYFQGDESDASADGSGIALLDFARPCPAYCN